MYYLLGFVFLVCVFWSAIFSTFGAHVPQVWGWLFTICVNAYIGTIHFDFNHTSVYLLHCRQPGILLLGAAWVHQNIWYDKQPSNFNSFSVGVKVVGWDDDGFVGGKLSLPSCQFWEFLALTLAKIFFVTRILHIDELAVTRFALWPRSSNVVCRIQIPAPLLFVRVRRETLSTAG